jgi:hypothetical protein
LSLRRGALDGLREETIAVAAIGRRDDPRTQKAIEQQIAGRIAGALAGQHQDAVHPSPGRRCGGLTTVVGLPGAGRDEGAGTLGLGFARQELQLAGLVAAEREAGLIVALDEEPRTPEQCGEPRQRLDGRRQVRQAQAGNGLGCRWGMLGRSRSDL